MSVVFADLHTHTTASDGLDEPDELISQACAIGLSAIAISDHDSVAGFLGLSKSNRIGLDVIPAVEMSSNFDEYEIHVLGYFVEPASAYLIEHLDHLQHQRLERIERFCARLTSIGLPLTRDEVMVYATGQSVGRPHVARAMIARGYVASVNEAFDRYLSGGKPGFVPRDDVTPEWCVDFIHRSHGVAVLAHPYTTGNPERTIERLCRVGLDGLEVEYGYYADEQRAFLRELASQTNLIPTGGSDYHGATHRSEVQLGSGGVSEAVVERIRDRAELYR